MQANVVVVGSLNMDLVTRTERLPQPGETLFGHSLATVHGGKGANQAVAAARLGAQVAMIGCVGSDAYGLQLREGLLAEQIDCHGVRNVEGGVSGVALIVVDANSQNTIVVVPGTNACLVSQDIDACDSALQKADVIVCQLEVPMSTVGYTLDRGRALNKTVILNPAPASGPLPVEWYDAVDYLIPNESEAQALSGVVVDSLDSAELAARTLMGFGAGKVIVTLGAQGALFVSEQRAVHFAAPKVLAVDATAAGDTFVGAFSAALAAGRSEDQAIRFAQVAAALSVTRSGAQPSIPYLSDVEGFSPS
ncbi:ribokinase [Pseudomonas weihenstephanensis]|uniref:Ribokinase n=1 Tax=Pseudomonas weihenstephanensis TaxID=1608994 RepID=A0ABS1ZGB4_9PSED|nr:ribokinase [Pseudomonas weihenstephanensis]MBM1195489.1 ribokinase [Pseudomonas weihenstephanensis]